ncbi:hypothetical protein AcV5_007910 [Taiwanofungus camphoratus]|nr:hypothetical protein AcV5_007910 [Antrodia cinnamomea]
MTTHTATTVQAQVDRLRHELQRYKVDDQVPEVGEQIYIGEYLVQRLVQLGVTKMFGVPGDFNLGFLDFVEDNPNIDWVGNCNELNAAYAADGYARVKEGSLGVLTTTFGVGELSAINGIAGAFSEHVPVLHIVGVPSTLQQKDKPMLHHTLGDGRYDAYYKASQQFTIAQATLTSKDTAAVEIDRIITECVVMARPVYLMLPTDLAYVRIPAKRLLTPLNSVPPENDAEVESFVLDEICKLVDEAGQDAIVLVDACAIRHGVKKEVAELVRRTGFPVYAAPMGKTAVDERYERYGGIYVGSISQPAIKEKVESAKLIISVGALKSDFNTGNFTYHIPTHRTIEVRAGFGSVTCFLLVILCSILAFLPSFRSCASYLVLSRPLPEFSSPSCAAPPLASLRLLLPPSPFYHSFLPRSITPLFFSWQSPPSHYLPFPSRHPSLYFLSRPSADTRTNALLCQLHSDHIRVRYAGYPGVGMKRLLPKLTARLQPYRDDARALPVPPYRLPVPKEDNDIITHTWLWPRVGQFFRQKDIVVAETGTSSFGVLDVPMPTGAIFMSQILWGSIGWTVGSTLGAALGGHDLGYKRTILFIGDGSLQLTVQELSVMIRSGMKPIIFVLNNKGYTIERYLHGMTRKYNDISNWKWTHLLDTLGGEEGKTCQSYRVTGKDELSTLFDDPTFAAADKIQLVEIMMEQRDAPRALKSQAELSGKSNQYVAV